MNKLASLNVSMSADWIVKTTPDMIYKPGDRLALVFFVDSPQLNESLCILALDTVGVEYVNELYEFDGREADRISFKLADIEYLLPDTFAAWNRL